MLLAGDIGGTKSRLAIYREEGGDARLPLYEAVLPSNRFAGIDELLKEFWRECREPVTAVVLALAGPVINGRSALTNLPWIVDEEQLCRTYGLRSVILLNDLTATAAAVPLLSPTELHTLYPGEQAASGPIAVIAPGTGLGEAFLIREGTRWQAYATEGGHAGFAPSNSLEAELLKAAWGETPHVAWEHFCSGPGVGRLYRFLLSRGADEPEWLGERLKQSGDPAPVITEVALTERDELCLQTLRLFLSLLGAEAGNFALKTLAVGGVYLGGGIMPRLLPLLAESGFLSAFQSKGLMTGLLRRIPVKVILEPRSALIGAAHLGLTGE